MSDVGTEDRDLNADSGIRKHIESAVATHAPDPDINSLVNGAVEENNRHIRERNDRKANGSDLKDIKPQDRLRASIRAAVQEAKRKAAQPQATAAKGAEAPVGPPVSWSSDAKAVWNDLPHDVRMAALREQKSYADAVTPLAKQYAEIEKAIAPHRDIIPKHISEPAAINELFGWYRALQSPHKATALAVLMNQTGVSLQDVANVVAQAQQYYQQQQQPQQFQQSQYQQADDPAIEAQKTAKIAATLATFSRDKPYFQAVRRSMGLLLSAHGEQYLRHDGETDLDKLYKDACRVEGYGAEHNRTKRAAAISPSTRSPSGPLSTTERGKGIRGAIKAAFQEARGQV
jgi:hypothetical protein